MHDQQTSLWSRCESLFPFPPQWRTFLSLWLLLLMPFLVVGCASQQGATLIIYAASSLTEAFTAIGTEFEARHADVQVVFNFAGSQALSTQLEHGAVADVFASADTVHMDRLQETGLLAEDPVSFAENRLVVALPAANPAKLRSVRDLARPGVRIVLAQENVPVGRYTRQALVNLSADAAYGSAFQEAVRANVRSEELNVRQVLAKVTLGEADAGFVYVSDVAASTANIVTLEIPGFANVEAVYPIALLTASNEKELAKRFIDFVRSPVAQEILQQAGLQAADFVADADTVADVDLVVDADFVADASP